MDIGSVVTFAAGAGYGFTTVVVGQPLDTIKTRMQGMPQNAQLSMWQVGREVYGREGVRGLYRGGLPLFLGGSLMRSAQFGVSGGAHKLLRESDLPKYHLFGIVDYQVALAGIAGGIGRGLVEVPTDFFKVRRQVERRWALRSILDGNLVTMGRNSLLFGSFVLYVDFSRQLCQTNVIPSFMKTADGNNLTPFAKGAICANLAWLSCWPFDVVKTQRQTQRQSGNYTASTMSLLSNAYRSGKLFRGIVPGLMRSTFSNGLSMMVYESIETNLSKVLGVERQDMV